ncbi:MAG: YicC family protein [bacterium]|nr:YicC family protein [bacterium]
MAGSMTGYGAGEAALGDSTLVVETRSVNHRYLETSIRGPRWSLSLEGAVREEVKKRFDRGRFDVFIHFEVPENGAALINMDAAREFVGSLRAVGKELRLSGDVSLEVLAQFRDSLKSVEPAISPEEAKPVLLDALGRALESLKEMRVREGGALQRDIVSHLGQVEIFTREIRASLPEIRAALTGRARERILQFAEGLQMEEGRLEQELVYAAEKGDISEELSRLESHISQFRGLLEAEGPIGRKLDFLLQEMNREANTVASKSVDLSITQRAVELKSAMEKIREQVQNIE